MNAKKLFAPALLAAAGLVGLTASLATADPAADSKSSGQPEFKLPEGWTQADMEACMVAGTPGEQHKHLAQDVGVWSGKSQMWMGPGSEPIASECKNTITSIMDGRFTKAVIEGDMAGMGPYSGLGFYGYDNLRKQYTSTWIDNQSTGIMQGTGKLSDDGKTMTWTYEHMCPITKKPTTMREVETVTGPNSKTLEMFGKDPKSGKEYKMMSIAFTKTGGEVVKSTVSK